MATLLSIASNEVHVWLARPQDASQPELLRSYESLLNETERARWLRFHFQRHRQQFLVTRALVRTTLSRYAYRPPASWRFLHNSHGRPAIEPERDVPALHFNLSHTDGLIACAVTLDREVGIDVEHTARDCRAAEVAERFFSADECRDLFALPRQCWQQRFFDYWTLKEAYIKARGMGLALPLSQFSFSFDSSGTIAIGFGPEIHDSPQRWQFRLLQPDPDHRLALCTETIPEGGDTLEIRRVIPFDAENLLSTTAVAAMRP